MNNEDMKIIEAYLGRKPYDIELWTPAETREWLAFIDKITKQNNFNQ